MSPPREIELKLEVSALQLPRLVRSLPAHRGSAKASTLTSVYFDTDKHDLHKKGFTLRVRRIGGRYVQTVKQERGDSGAVFARHEWEHDIGGRLPDLDVTKETGLAPALGKKLRRLNPVFQTRIRRTTYLIRTSDSDIDVAIDKGMIETDGRSEPLCEVELELKRGDVAELFKLAHVLAEHVPLRLAVRSKSTRGYALLNGKEPRAFKAAAVSVTPEHNRQTAFQAIARTCLYQLAANSAGTHDGDTESLHQMRVALRRLRAAISLFPDMLFDSQTKSIKVELKWINSELGPARELDVFMNLVVTPMANSKPRGPGSSAIAKDLGQRRAAAFERAREAVDSARFRDLLLEIAAWIEAGHWIRTTDDLARARREQPIGAAAIVELERRRRKILKRGAHLLQLEPQVRHRVRIDAKKLRYAAEFFSGAFPGKKSARRIKAFLRALEDLQTALGSLNDIAVHRQLVERILEAQDPGDKRRFRMIKAFAAGRLAGHEEARAAPILKDAERAYRALAKAKPFWH